MRLYDADVELLQSPYIAPAENAGRGGIQWVALLPAPSHARSCPGVIVAHAPVKAARVMETWPLRAGDKSHAASNAFLEDTDVVCVPGAGLHFSASYHSIMTLLRSKHQHELEGGPCQLHIDGMHMGVGGDDSWTPSVRHCLLHANVVPRRTSVAAYTCACVQLSNCDQKLFIGPHTGGSRPLNPQLPIILSSHELSARSREQGHKSARSSAACYILQVPVMGKLCAICMGVASCHSPRGLWTPVRQWWPYSGHSYLQVHCKYLLPPGLYQYSMKVKAALGWTKADDVVHNAQSLLCKCPVSRAKYFDT